MAHVKKTLSYIVLSLISHLSVRQPKPNALLDFVNTLMGTTSKMILSAVNTFDADKITEFKKTHQLSQWINDMGNLPFCPLQARAVLMMMKEQAGFRINHVDL
ncbi:hypothetical protein [Emticicia agri]|uniref:hypothetical protein n=1 Tax=Emticicia agri TaxID=2492393 RepID=UPI001A912401|nr:hypothetical protein [Emticicia agri]